MSVFDRLCDGSLKHLLSRVVCKIIGLLKDAVNPARCKTFMSSRKWQVMKINDPLAREH
jgi:hypothetical protein